MKENYEARWAAGASRLQTTMKGWRDSHPTATFWEIEEALETELAKLRAEMLSDLAGASAAAEGQTEGGERVVCPECGRQAHRHGHRKRELTAAGDQTVELTRRVLTCSVCGHTFFPSGQ